MDEQSYAEEHNRLHLDGRRTPSCHAEDHLKRFFITNTGPTPLQTSQTRSIWTAVIMQ